MTSVISKHSSRKGLPERLYSGVTPWILIYYLATSLFILVPLGGFIRDVFVTPLYFVLPTGFGLLLLSAMPALDRVKSRLTIGQLLFCAFVIGSVLITILFQSLEKANLLKNGFMPLFALIKVASLAGFLLFRRNQISGPKFRNVAFDFVLVSPIILFNYWIKYFVFGQYPLRDIFQETHFMKGAVELSRFQILNPHTADSYIPIVQVLLGLFHHFYSYDLINSQWILPVFFSVFHFAVFYEVIGAFGLGDFARRIGLALGMTFLGFFTLTNGDLAQQLSLIVLATLVMWAGEGVKVHRWLLIAVVGGLVTVLPFYVSKQMGLDATWGVGMVVIIGLWGMTGGWMSADWAVLGMLMAVAPFVHRGSLLFVCIALVGYVGYMLIRREGSREMMIYKTYGVAVLGVLAFIVVTEVAMVNVLVYLGMVEINRYTKEFLIYLWGMVLGMEFNQSDLAIASGKGIMPTVEWIRGSTPLLQMLVSILVLLFSVKKIKEAARARSIAEWEESWKSPQIDLVLWGVIGWGVTAVVSLSGLPFIYRLKYFNVLFGIIIVSVVCGYLYEEYLEKRGSGSNRLFRFVLFLAIVSGAYTGLAQKWLYDFHWHAELVPNEYLRQLHPYTLAWVALIGTLVVLAVVRAGHRTGAVAAIAAVVMSVMLDKVAMTTKWMEVSYGSNAPGRPVVVSHYTKRELDVAQRLALQPAERVLFSDPYTLSIMRGLSGLNSLYTFSNIGTVDERIEPVLQNAIRVLNLGDLRPATRVDRLCRGLDGFVRGYLGTPEVRYVYESRLGKKLHAAVEEGNVLVVLTEKTMKWAVARPGRRVGYYPMNGKIDKTVLEVLDTPFVRVVENIDDRVLVFSLDCNAEHRKLVLLGDR